MFKLISIVQSYSEKNNFFKHREIQDMYVMKELFRYD